MVKAWDGRQMALGGGYNFNVTGTAVGYRAIFKDLGAGGVLVIPSVDPNAAAGYIAVAKSLVGRYAPGLLVRTDLNNLPTIGSWVTTNGWATKDCDLVIWLSHIAAIDPATLQAVVTTAIRTHIPNFSSWKSVTLASSAAAKDFGALPPGRSLVPRRDWQLWTAMHAALPALDYGDTGHVHPSLEEPPGVAMGRATVSVRYTTDSDWIAIKGTSTTGAKGKPMGDQYKAHAKALVKEPAFNKLPACWADGEITKIANGSRPKAGSRATWVGLSLNRHISLVANRLP